MPVFKEVGPEARQRLVKGRSKGYQQRQVYRDMLSQLGDGKQYEIQPEAGETIRTIKVNVRRAANELSMDIVYGETADGTLLVWRQDSRRRRRQRRVRKPEVPGAS